MKKRWMIILMAVSMLMFGSTAFTGDGSQDKATSESNLTGAVMLANNSQVSFQVDDKALENFGVGEEEMGQENTLIAVSTCDDWCSQYNSLCPEISQGNPLSPICEAICNICEGCDGACPPLQ